MATITRRKIHVAADLVRRGAPIVAVCDALGIPRRSFYRPSPKHAADYRALQAELAQALDDARLERARELEQLLEQARQDLRRR